MQQYRHYFRLSKQLRAVYKYETNIIKLNQLTTSCGFLSFKKYLSNCNKESSISYNIMCNCWNKNQKNSKYTQKFRTIPCAKTYKLVSESIGHSCDSFGNPEHLPVVIIITPPSSGLFPNLKYEIRTKSSTWKLSQTHSCSINCVQVVSNRSTSPGDSTTQWSQLTHSHYRTDI